VVGQPSHRSFPGEFTSLVMQRCQGRPHHLPRHFPGRFTRSSPTSLVLQRYSVAAPNSVSLDFIILGFLCPSFSDFGNSLLWGKPVQPAQELELGLPSMNTPQSPRGPPTEMTHRSAEPIFVSDPSAGSPTETLLRLLLPLNDTVWTSFQNTDATRKPHRSQSEVLTKSFNR